MIADKTFTDISTTEEQWLEKRKEPFEIPGTLMESFTDKENNEYNVYKVSINPLILFIFFFFPNKFIFRQPLQTPRAKLYMTEFKYLYFYSLRLVPTLMMKMTIGNFFCFTAIKTVYLSLPGFVRFMSTFGLKTQSCTILTTTRKANPLLQTCASEFRNL